MNYKTIKDLNDTIINGLPLVPRDVDLIVGIPRSGLLAANLLALYLNLPIADIDGLVNGKIINTGERYKRKINSKPIKDIKNFKKVLVVDDTISSGEALLKAKKIINKSNLKIELLYTAIYINPSQKKSVDFFFETCSSPFLFEWNIMHHSILEKSCIDIDGVLCRDPSVEEDDDGEKYLNFIKNAIPFFIPTLKTGYLVTCRLEKYREETEDWLKKQNIIYKKLIMMNLPDKKTREKLNNHAEYKAAIYKKTKSQLFIESSFDQSIVIANNSGKLVFCIENRQMIWPNSLLPKTKIKTRSRIKAMHNLLFYKIKKTPLVHPYNIIKEIYKNIIDEKSLEKRYNENH